ncbi:extracellular solute-binding protein [Patescibacteria group bacterium]|nr:extracellular solute-binding protein [Patescibacteria group bacterium]
MPDPNQDQPLDEEPLTDSEPDKPTPPWQAEEEVEPEGEEVGTEPSPGFAPPVVEEIEEESDLAETPEEETAPVEEPFPSEMPSEEETTPLETPPEISPEEPLPSGPPGPVEAFHIEKKSPFGAVKKILPIILGLILVVGLVFLIIKVGLPRFQKPKEITLTYWGLWEPESVMRQVIADWNKDNPNIKINYSMQSKLQYRERVQSALARGEGPDIFRYHATWLPMFKNQLDSVPTEVMSTSQFEAAFYPIAASQLRSGTSYLGIPLEIDTLSLFYNKDIFQTAGKTPPTTWDELRRVAIELTTHDEAGRIQTAGVALGTTNNIEHWSDILGLMMLQNEADLANPTGSLAEDALIFYTIFNKTDRVWDLTLPNSMLAFASGDLAMYFGYSWDVFEIKNINPDLEFGVVEAPQLAGTNIAWASFWVEGVNNKSEHKEEAWEFLKYLSSKETLTKLYQAESQLRLFGEPYSRVEMADQARTNPLVAPFVDQAPRAQTWYLCSRTYDNGINDKMIDYFKDAVNAINANENPADALATTASGVAQLLSQYGLSTAVTR